MSDLSAICPVLVGNESTWQSILDACQVIWQYSDTMTYSEFVDETNKKYGPLAKLAVLLAKYNYQVCNGGHAQYWDNGYASRTTSGFMQDHEEMELHEELIALVKEHLDIELKDELLSIMKEFDIDVYDTCEECDGSGEFECDDCIGTGDNVCDQCDGDDEECSKCDGTGVIECIECDGSGHVDCGCCNNGVAPERTILAFNDNELDSRYYRINEKIEEQTETFFEKAIEHYSKTIA